MADVGVAPEAGGASNPNDLLSPPKQVDIEQAPSPEEALEPNKIKQLKKNAHQDNQLNSHSKSNGNAQNGQISNNNDHKDLPNPSIGDGFHKNVNARQSDFNEKDPTYLNRPLVPSASAQSENKSIQKNKSNESESKQNIEDNEKSAVFGKQDNAGLKPSPDFDMSDVKSKPPPRQPVDPTFRGWKEVGGYEADDALTAADESVDLLSKGSIFDQYLPAIMYGDWYHNTAYLILGGLLSWIVGWFRFSVAPLFFIMVIFSLLYRASVKKYRGILREQAQREFSVKQIEDDYETMDWCNYFLEKFWYFLEPSISQIVCDQANPIMAGLPIPAFVSAVWLDTFTLGTKPPRIDKVKTLIGTADDVVVMDWGFSFTPNANVDANNKQLKNNVNENIVVKATVFGVTLPITIADVSFKGLARIRLRLMTSFPHVETVNVSMIKPPQYDFNTKILGEASWWWEVLAFPGLYPLINEMVKKYVGPILFNPMSFQLNVQQLLAGNALDSAIGVLAINVHSARGLKGFKTLGNTLDPYLTFGFRNKVLARTKTISDTDAPKWDETIYVPVSSLSEPLTISVIDYNDFRKDRQVGAVQFDLEALIDNPKQPNLTAAFLRNNKPVGELSFGINYMKTLEPEKQADGATTPPPDLNTGIARIEVVEARHLKGGDKGASTSAELIFDNKTVIETPVQKNTNTPGWGATTEQIVFNRAKAKAKLLIKDQNGKVIGKISHTLNELIDATQVEQTWFPLSKGGEVRINTTWKPVQLEGASGAGGYTNPIGVIRVDIEHAEDLRNLETIGKIDPYARILINGFEKARTAAVDSSLDPTWNEVHYVSISSPNQKLTIEVMDVESHSADRTLGSFDVKLNEFIQKDERGQYIEHVDKKQRTNKLISKKGPKGSVTYTLSFYPCLPVMTLQDYKDEEEDKKNAEEEKKKLEDLKQDSKAPSGMESSDELKQQESKDKNEIEEDDEDEESYGQKLRLSLDQLIAYKSGILVFEIIKGTIPKNDTYLQVYSGNQGYPDFISEKLTKKESKIEITGDSTITELEWSKTCFRLVKEKSDNRVDKCVAELTIPTLQLLKNGYDKPMSIQLEGSGNASFEIRFSWVPLIYQSGIPPQDSSDNSGILTINVEHAKGLPASDRNGFSDPFIKLYLNTEKNSFFKTKTIKKTLDPKWNQKTTVEVANLYDSVLKFVCYDWDMADANDLLGTGLVDLNKYDMKKGPVEVEIPLESEEGDPAGFAYAELSFKPEFVLNVKPKSQTGIGQVGHGVGTVGKGVAGAGKGIGSLGFKGASKGVEAGYGAAKGVVKKIF
ncbi:TCB1 [Candida pseudojiufengensis]|uniref:TCB1 n=1 Tax=Candida pseudojiufengensis TaxID=497109 RepID=UPI002224A92A|nr:TCB1 [Candida pseudojiufengensis]KAI5963517.1 TCB1 [Candida pseudojiufengensis]